MQFYTYFSGAFRELGQIAKRSPHHADLYVFVTGPGKGGTLGVAYVGTVCNSARTHRVSINRYGIAGSQKSKTNNSGKL